MAFLFGTSVESGYDKELESEDYKRHSETRRLRKPNNYRRQPERFHYKKTELNDSSSDGEESNSKRLQYTRNSISREHSVKRRGRRVPNDKNEQFSDHHRSEEHFNSKSYCFYSDDAEEGSSKEVNDDLAKKRQRNAANMPEHDRRHEIEDRSSSSKRKIKLYSEDQENSQSKSHKKHYKKKAKNDRHAAKSDLYRDRTPTPSNEDSLGKQSLRSKNLFDEKSTSDNLVSDEDYGYHYEIQSSKRRKCSKHSSQQRRSQDRYMASKVRKGNLGEEDDEDSPGRWKVSEEYFLVEET